MHVCVYTSVLVCVCARARARACMHVHLQRHLFMCRAFPIKYAYLNRGMLDRSRSFFFSFFFTNSNDATSLHNEQCSLK